MRWKARRHLLVHAGEDAVHEFQHDDFGAEAIPDGAHLQADRARRR